MSLGQLEVTLVVWLVGHGLLTGSNHRKYPPLDCVPAMRPKPPPSTGITGAVSAHMITLCATGFVSCSPSSVTLCQESGSESADGAE